MRIGAFTLRTFWKEPVLAVGPWTDYADVLAGLRVIVEGP